MYMDMSSNGQGLGEVFIQSLDSPDQMVQEEATELTEQEHAPAVDENDIVIISDDDGVSSAILCVGY